ncbi:15719_t:CDS:1, partial [Gigaspora rosea]
MAWRFYKVTTRFSSNKASIELDILTPALLTTKNILCGPKHSSYNFKNPDVATLNNTS